MTMQSSGEITFAQIQTEHSGSNPIGLNEYYRGGSLTAFNPQNTNIPTSGTIATDDFYTSRGFGATNGFIFTAGTTGGKTASVGYWATNTLGSITQSSATQASTKVTLIGRYIATYDYLYLKACYHSGVAQNFLNSKTVTAKTGSFNGTTASSVNWGNGNNKENAVGNINAGPYNGETEWRFNALVGWNTSPNRTGSMSSGTTYYVTIA